MPSDPKSEKTEGIDGFAFHTRVLSLTSMNTFYFFPIKI